VPEICRFYGIVIKMFWNDHDPPHFHAEYGEHVALVDIGTLAVIDGALPGARPRTAREARSAAVDWRGEFSRRVVAETRAAHRLNTAPHRILREVLICVCAP